MQNCKNVYVCFDSLLVTRGWGSKVENSNLHFCIFKEMQKCKDVNLYELDPLLVTKGGRGSKVENRNLHLCISKEMQKCKVVYVCFGPLPSHWGGRGQKLKTEICIFVFLKKCKDERCKEKSYL